MSLQGNIQKLKKAQSKKKTVYMTYDNYEYIHGKITEIGNVFVHLETEESSETVILDIDKIIDISLIKSNVYG